MKLRRQSKSKRDEEAKTAEEVGRSVRALLNKLTAERFERLFVQLTGLVNDSCFGKEHLAAVVSEIFKKAINDHAFCHLYADICSRLDIHLTKPDEMPTAAATIRSSLQRECQARFERELSQAGDRSAFADLEGDALYEMEVKLKCGRLGNMRFMGELLLRKLLPSDVITASSKELLGVSGDGGNAVESLISLLHVIAPKFHSFDASFAKDLTETCTALSRRSDDASLPPRIRFLIRDLLVVLPKPCLVQTPPPSPPSPPSQPAVRGSRRSFGHKWRPRRDSY
jgi:hypothetical protein